MTRSVVILTVIVALSACSRDRRYVLQGQVLAVDPARQELTVRHEDIQGFMPAMTMPFRVADRRVLQERKPGDLIQATLVVTDSSGRLEDVIRTGEAPLPPDLPRPGGTVLDAGASVADAAFVDQAGRGRRLSEWRGKTVAVTFVYTRCPLPDFCPLMDRNFAALQHLLSNDPLSARVHLLSVTFDPDYDSPAVLKTHATAVGARPETWTWLTGERQAIDAFATQFGVTIIRSDRPLQEIVHNLRTIVIDRDGRVVRIFNGNEWKPEELLQTLRAADAH